jgi:hypothetical protein
MSKIVESIGSVHGSIVDPAGLLPNNAVDPLGLFGANYRGKGKAIAAPAPAPAPMAMPTPDDEAVKAARRRQLAAAQTRGGRQSTILSGDDRLGG